MKALTDAKLNAYCAESEIGLCQCSPPSGDQRTVMARHVKKLGEEAKVAIRGVRQDARKQIAAWGRGSQLAVQEATDASIVEIDRLVRAKLAALGE